MVSHHGFAMNLQRNKEPICLVVWDTPEALRGERGAARQSFGGVHRAVGR